MPRKMRLEYEGAKYHVMSRGNNRGIIFEDDEDRKVFLGTLGQACVLTPISGALQGDSNTRRPLRGC